MGIEAAIIGSAVVGGIGSVAAGRAQSRAARRATQAQERQAQMSIAEQRRQFNVVQQLFQPYVQAGTGTLAQQLNLIGAGGPEAQQTAIDAIRMGPEYQQLVQAGEEAILQQASATGGLRGGNVQRSLAEFRPQVLSNLINQQYSRLGGITQLGQASAAGQAAQGSQISAGIAQTQADLGAALAQGALAQGQARANMFGNIAGAIGTGLGQFAGFKTFGGLGQTAAQPTGVDLSSIINFGGPNGTATGLRSPFGG